MRVVRYLWLAGVFLLTGAVWAEEGLSPESEAWNAALESYSAGEVTNALEQLKALRATKTHGVRAAEVVAKIEYDLAQQEDPTNRLEHLEAAAAAAQVALRATPGDARANDNFTRATAGLAEMRERKRVADVLAAAEGKDPVALLKDGRDAARKVWAGVREVPSLSAAQQVRKTDELEAEAKRLDDLWLVLRQNVTNLTEQIDAARDLTREAAKAIGDLDGQAADRIGQAEDALSAFYVGALPADQAMAEGLLAQTNAWGGVEAIGASDWQRDALACTQVFRQRFPEWADQYEQSRQANTNAPPLTADVRKQIEDLAERLEETQTACCQMPDKAKQKEALEQARQILEWLPREPPQDQPDQQQQNQDRQQNQEPQSQDRNQEQDPQDRQQEPQDQQQEQQQDRPEPQEKPQDDRQDQAEAKAADAKESSEDEKRDAELLRRVLEQSAERNVLNMKKRERAAESADRDW